MVMTNIYKINKHMTTYSAKHVSMNNQQNQHLQDILFIIKSLDLP